MNFSINYMNINLGHGSLCFRIVDVILHPLRHEPSKNKLFFKIVISYLNVFR